jgi:RNA polymerase sigma factor (sigma-70 family)
MPQVQITGSFVQRPENPQGESGLLSQLRQRQRMAQENVIATQGSALRALAASHLICPNDAQSLVADVFTDFLYSYVDNLQHEKAVPAYLRMMVIRRARRQNQRASQHRDLEGLDFASTNNRDPSQMVDEGRRSTWLDECLGRMAERPRRLLRLHFGQDMSLSTIAAQFNISKQAVGKTVQKCLIFLRSCLAEKGDV